MGIEDDSVSAPNQSICATSADGMTQIPTHPDSGVYEAFYPHLNASGFTLDQLRLINDALREVGLDIVRRHVDRDC